MTARGTRSCLALRVNHFLRLGAQARCRMTPLNPGLEPCPWRSQSSGVGSSSISPDCGTPLMHILAFRKGPTYLTNHPTDHLFLSISQKILDIICNFCIHDDMYTEPQIYHLSFDIKSTKNSTEYNTIWDAINTVFETYRDNDCYIDILDSSCLIFSFETEKEIMNKLKNAIIANYGDSDKFWYFISSVNSQYDSYCLTKDKRVLFNEFSKTAFGF